MTTATHTAANETQNKNQILLAQKMEQFNKRGGVRVGDFVRLPTIDSRQKEYTRITHVWSETAQTGNGSYFIDKSGYLQYSGGLDSGLALDDLQPSEETKTGAVWFFSGDEVKAHNGVTFQAEMRVFTVKKGADVSGCWNSLACPYHLSVLTEKQMQDFGGRYKYCIQKNSCSHTAFNTEGELTAWLRGEDLILLNGRIEYPATATAQKA